MASYTGRWAQMELQPGHINWSGVPVLLYPGAVRLWIWTAFAHGAEFVTTYRFRQPLWGTELFHQGLMEPDGVTPSVGGREFAQTIDELSHLDPAKYANTPATPPAVSRPGPVTATNKEQLTTNTEVGLVFDFDQLWYFETLPQATRWNQPRWLVTWYRALMRLGLRVQILHPNQPWPTDLPLIVAPSLQMVDDALVQQFDTYASSGGNLVLTSRSAYMNRHGHLFEAPTSAPILKLIGGSVEAYDALPEDTFGHVEMDGHQYPWGVWGSLLYTEPDTRVLAKYADQFYAGAPAITQHKYGTGTVTFCGVCAEPPLIHALTEKLATQFKLPATPLPDRTSLVRRGQYSIFLNYQDQPVTAPAPKNARFLVGTRKVDPAGVAVWEG
jgi:beta-galactosidase